MQPKLGPQLGEPLIPAGHDALYLDWNATTPLFPEVCDEIKLLLEQGCYGNASSGHVFGRLAKAKLDWARQEVAKLVNSPSPSSIIFTSSGSESDNWAIQGAVQLYWQRNSPSAPPPHVVTSSIDHPAILAFLEDLQARGQITYTALPVSEEGRVDAAAVESAIRPETCLITIMHSNNEVGSVQPIQEIVARVRGRREAAGGDGSSILIHSDAAQSLGKVPVDVQDLGVDLLTIVGHKFGAPKGVAALYVAPSLRPVFPKFLHGGGQEGGKRAGTENLLLIAGMGRAASVVTAEAPRLCDHQRAMRNHLLALLQESFADSMVRVNGPRDESIKLSNTLSVGIRGLASSRLLSDLKDSLAASAGAACHSSASSVSSVLRAMNVPLEFAQGTLRLSTGRHTSVECVEGCADLIAFGARQQGLELTARGKERAARGELRDREAREKAQGANL